MDEIDMNTLLEQAFEAGINKFLSILDLGDSEGKSLIAMLNIFTSRNIPILTAFEILADLAILSEEKETNDNE